MAFCGRVVNAGERECRDAEEEEKAGRGDGGKASGSEDGTGTGGYKGDPGQEKEAGEAQKGLDCGSDGVEFHSGKNWGTPPPF